jgi:hypothetical protein
MLKFMDSKLLLWGAFFAWELPFKTVGLGPFKDNPVLLRCGRWRRLALWCSVKAESDSTVLPTSLIFIYPTRKSHTTDSLSRTICDLSKYSIRISIYVCLYCTTVLLIFPLLTSLILLTRGLISKRSENTCTICMYTRWVLRDDDNYSAYW